MADAGCESRPSAALGIEQFVRFRRRQRDAGIAHGNDMSIPDIRDLCCRTRVRWCCLTGWLPPTKRVCAPKCAFARTVCFVVRTVSAAWVGLEYMAQAIGAYAGYTARLRGEPVRIGYLLGTRRYECKPAKLRLGQPARNLCQARLAKRKRLGFFRVPYRRRELAGGQRLTSPCFSPPMAKQSMNGQFGMSQSVLVTGSSRGIGKAIAAALGARRLRYRRALPEPARRGR